MIVSELELIRNHLVNLITRDDVKDEQVFNDLYVLVRKFNVMIDELQRKEELASRREEDH
jgi:hypothetical protein